MKFADPNTKNALISFKTSYENYIDGAWTSPINGQYFDVTCPITGQYYTKVPRSDERDVELATTAAQKAFKTWSSTTVSERSQILFKMADIIEQNLQMLAVAESWGNGKPIRETLAADLPLVIDHFRYFASVIRGEEGSHVMIDRTTSSTHINEPLGIVAQIIPWNFPLLMAAWKMAPALAAGNCVILKPAEQTPVSILILAELIADILPNGVLNILNGFGSEVGKPLARSPHIAKVAFTGETTTGKLIMEYASENIIPVTLELGGKSPNIFLSDIFDQDDKFVAKCIEGFNMFAFNQGEVCTCPSRALIHESIYDRFIELALSGLSKIKFGHPLDTDTMMGAQTSAEQQEKILKYIGIGAHEGAKILCGGKKHEHALHESGYYVEPTILEGHNSMQIFQEEIFGPVVCVTKFKTVDEAIQIANDTPYGLGAGVWTRNIHHAHTLAHQIKSGRVWTNCYHLYPAHAAFGGYKKSGIGRETHKMMLAHYTQTKNILTSYSMEPLGFY